MSHPVALDELARRVEEYGPHPFLVTTGADGRPHVVSVGAAFDGEAFTVAAGSTSRANAAANPVSLLWPGPDGPYCLIVDGTATTDAESLRLTPTRAVLHRQAHAADDLPTCVRIEPEP